MKKFTEVISSRTKILLYQSFLTVVIIHQLIIFIKLTNNGHFPKANFLKSAKIISVDQACPEFCQNIITRSSNLTRSLNMAHFSNFDNFNGQPRVVPGSQEIRGNKFIKKFKFISFFSHSPKN